LGMIAKIFSMYLLFCLLVYASSGFELIFGTWWIMIGYIVAVAIFSAKNIFLFRNREDDEICLNAGGGLLPMVMATYMIYLFATELGFGNGFFIIFLIVLPASIAAYLTSRYIPGNGVVTLAIGVPAVLFILVNIFTPMFGDLVNEPFTAKLLLGFVGSTYASFVGCDIFHLKEIGYDNRFGDKPSIGGAGICDGVFVSGILTMVLLMMQEHLVVF